MSEVPYTFAYICLGNLIRHGSLAGYNPWGCKELDTTEQLRMKQEKTYNYLYNKQVIKVFLQNIFNLKKSIRKHIVAY